MYIHVSVLLCIHLQYMFVKSYLSILCMFPIVKDDSDPLPHVFDTFKFYGIFLLLA